MSGASLVGPLVHVGALPPFTGLSTEHLRAIAAECEEVVFGADSWLWRAGDPHAALYLVLDGHVRVLRGGAEHRIGPGGVVGFPEMLAAGATAAAGGALAEVEVVALRLGTDALRDVCERNMPVLEALLVYMADAVADRPEAHLGLVSRASAPGPSPYDGPLDRVGRTVALHRVPEIFAAGMDPIVELAGRVGVLEAEPGLGLWTPGEAADRVWVVASGSVRLEEGSGERVAGAGSVPGLVEAVAGRRHGGRAVVAEPATLLTVGMDPFMDLLADHIELGFGLLRCFAQALSADPRG